MMSLDDQEGRLKTQVLAVDQKKMGRRETKEGRSTRSGRGGAQGTPLPPSRPCPSRTARRWAASRPTRTRVGGRALVNGRQKKCRRSMTQTIDGSPLLVFDEGVGQRKEGRLLGRLDAAPVRVVGHEEGRHDEEHDDDHEGGPPRAGRKNSNDSPGEGGARRAAPPLPPARTRASRGGEILFPKALSSAVKK